MILELPAKPIHDTPLRHSRMKDKRINKEVDNEEKQGVVSTKKESLGSSHMYESLVSR